MDRDPGRAARDVEHRVEERPVADRVGTVAHRFGLAVRRGDAAAVEMIAADHDRRLQLTARDHRIERQADPVAVAQTDPADPRRQPLKRDPLMRHVEPAVQMRVVRQQLLDLRVGLRDVVGIARERDPAERSDPAAEQRPDVRRHESRVRERVRKAGLERHLANVVAVVERRDAEAMKRDHGFDVRDHRALRRLGDGLRIALACFAPLLERPAGGEIAVDRIVRRGLIGHRIRAHPAPQQLGDNLGRVPDDPDRHGDLRALRLLDQRERFVERRRVLVEVARRQAFLDARRIALDREHRRAGHRRGERLRAAHPAQAGGEDPLAGEIAAVMLPAELGERLVRPLHDPLRADIDPRTGRHLAVHHQPFAVELVEVLPGRPMRDEVGVGEHDARRIGMGAEDADRFAGLDRQRLVVAEAFELRDDAIERGPVARGFPDPAVDDEVAGTLGDLRIEIVHQHAQGGFRLPAACAQRGTARCPDRANRIVDHA